MSIYEKYPRGTKMPSPEMLRAMQAEGINSYQRPGGGFAISDQEVRPLIQGILQKLNPGMTGAAVAGGMAVPSQTGIEPGEQFMGNLAQQQSALGGPVPQSDEIGAMIQEIMSRQNPASTSSGAAPKEEYPGLLDEDMGSQTDWTEEGAAVKKYPKKKKRSMDARPSYKKPIEEASDMGEENMFDAAMNKAVRNSVPTMESGLKGEYKAKYGKKKPRY